MRSIPLPIDHAVVVNTARKTSSPRDDVASSADHVDSSGVGTSSSLMAAYRFARFIYVYLRYAANANTTCEQRNERESEGRKITFVALNPNENQLVQHVETYLSSGSGGYMGVNLRKASSTSPYSVRNLQLVDKLGHWDCLCGVPKDVHSLELGIFVSSMLTNNIMQLERGTRRTPNDKAEAYLAVSCVANVGCCLRVRLTCERERRRSRVESKLALSEFELTCYLAR